MDRLVDGQRRLLRKVLSHYRSTRLCVLTLLLGATATSAVAQDEALVSRDKQIRHGRIQFARTDVFPKGTFSSQEDLTFSADGRFRHQVKNPTRLGDKLVSITFVSGRGWRYVQRETTDDTWVVFDDVSSWPYDSDWRFFLVGRPCFALAAGLGSLKSIETEGATTRGKFGDGTNAELVRDPDGNLRSMTRSYQGKIWNLWTYDGSVSAGESVFVPRVSRHVVPEGTGKVDRTFKIDSADLDMLPSEEQLQTEWFRKGISIIDNRVRPQVEWSYDELLKANGGIDSITPAKLLELSRQKSRYFAETDAAKRKYEAKQQSSSESSLVGAGVVFAVMMTSLTLGSLAVSRIKRRKA